MKNFLLITIFIFSLSGCRPVREIPVRTETVIRERAVPIVAPEDSATVGMSFECDSLYNLILKRYDEQKTVGVETSFKQNKNSVEMSFKTNPDTVYVFVSDTTTTQDKPVIVEVEKQEAGSVLTKILWLAAAISGMICATVVVTIFFKKK